MSIDALEKNYYKWRSKIDREFLNVATTYENSMFYETDENNVIKIIDDTNKERVIDFQEKIKKSISFSEIKNFENTKESLGVIKNYTKLLIDAIDNFIVSIKVASQQAYIELDDKYKTLNESYNSFCKGIDNLFSSHYKLSENLKKLSNEIASAKASGDNDTASTKTRNYNYIREQRDRLLSEIEEKINKFDTDFYNPLQQLLNDGLQKTS